MKVEKQWSLLQIMLNIHQVLKSSLTSIYISVYIPYSKTSTTPCSTNKKA